MPRLPRRAPARPAAPVLPDGNAELEADEADVRRFLRRADALVPPGRETRHLDLDELIARLVS